MGCSSGPAGCETRDNNVPIRSTHNVRLVAFRRFRDQPRTPTFAYIDSPISITRNIDVFYFLVAIVTCIPITIIFDHRHHGSLAGHNKFSSPTDAHEANPQTVLSRASVWPCWISTWNTRRMACVQVVPAMGGETRHCPTTSWTSVRPSGTC